MSSTIAPMARDGFLPKALSVIEDDVERNLTDVPSGLRRGNGANGTTVGAEPDPEWARVGKSCCASGDPDRVALGRRIYAAVKVGNDTERDRLVAEAKQGEAA